MCVRGIVPVPELGLLLESPPYEACTVTLPTVEPLAVTEQLPPDSVHDDNGFAKSLCVDMLVRAHVRASAGKSWLRTRPDNLKRKS